MKNLGFFARGFDGKCFRRSLALVSLLSLLAFVFPAAAQTGKFKQLGGSALSAANIAAQAGDTGTHPALADSVLYNFCGAYIDIGYFPPTKHCIDTDPVTGLTQDVSGNGNLYGTSVGPAPGLIPDYLDLYPQGSVFMMNYGSTTTLHTFQPGEDGQFPAGSLVQDASGNLYGTTEYGSANGNSSDQGIVYEIQAPIQAGATYKVLYSFEGGSADGAHPVSSLVLDAYNNLYGTTKDGGAYSFGTVFELCSGTSGGGPPCNDGNTTEHVIYSFPGGGYGAYPLAGLIWDSAGNLWGTTAGGGNVNSNYCVDPAGGNSCGMFFELGYVFSSYWIEEPNRYAFCSATNCADGANPAASVLLVGSGNNETLYGTTEFGGTSTNCFTGGCGTVFGYSPYNPTMTTLYSFCQSTNCPDGANPVAPLIGPDTNGDLHGTTAGGGAGNGICGYGNYVSGCGTAFSISSTGSESVIYNFCSSSNCTDGQNPLGGLVAQGGYFYGTTSGGGNLGDGTVFELYTPCRFCLVLNTNLLQWNQVAVGKVGPPKFVQVTNSGNEVAQISSIEISGEFVLLRSKKSPCGSTLAPGATCLIEAAFKPTQLGLQTGTITITDNADNSPQTVSLSGTGIK